MGNLETLNLQWEIIYPFLILFLWIILFIRFSVTTTQLVIWIIWKCLDSPNFGEHQRWKLSFWNSRQHDYSKKHSPNAFKNFPFWPDCRFPSDSGRKKFSQIPPDSPDSPRLLVPIRSWGLGLGTWVVLGALGLPGLPIFFIYWCEMSWLKPHTIFTTNFFFWNKSNLTNIFFFFA